MKLTQEQVGQFEAEGFLLVRKALQDEAIDPLIAEYEAFIDRRARQLHAEGKISDVHADAPFDRRLAKICKECGEIYPQLDIMKLRAKAAFAFLRNDDLLDMVEAFVGPEITCSPIQHMRAKSPQGLSTSGKDPHVLPWHQDAGVTWKEADSEFILTVWLPLTRADENNGCLQVIPGVVGSGLRPHETRAGKGTVIVDAHMPDGKAVILPMDKGDVLFFHKETPHRSTPNLTDTVRWSLDLRYQKTGTPTGRPFHPAFVARSRANPDSEFREWAEWDRLWAAAEAQAAIDKPRNHRWQVVAG
jgi:ectoine hydroxylase-related dioxygenase (phytanoyl-CoA dioxygenase family)